MWSIVANGVCGKTRSRLDRAERHAHTASAVPTAAPSAGGCHMPDDALPESASSLAAPRPQRLSDVLAGLGIGLLLGTVVGLATSPVVAYVVGGLTSLLAVLLGLEGRGDGKPAVFAKVQINGLRIGVFGLAAVVGVLFGQWMRINNPLAEPPERSLARWNRAFPDNPALATQLMVHERLGLLPSALRLGGGTDAPVVVSAQAAALRPGLMSGGGTVQLCSELAPARFGNRSEPWLDAWGDEQGAYAEVAQRIRQMPPEHRLPALQAAHALVCAWAAAPASGAAR
jgi:hypothetical protein